MQILATLLCNYIVKRRLISFQRDYGRNKHLEIVVVIEVERYNVLIEKLFL